MISHKDLKKKDIGQRMEKKDIGQRMETKVIPSTLNNTKHTHEWPQLCDFWGCWFYQHLYEYFPEIPLPLLNQQGDSNWVPPEPAGAF